MLSLFHSETLTLCQNESINTVKGHRNSTYCFVYLSPLQPDISVVSHAGSIVFEFILKLAQQIEKEEEVGKGSPPHLGSYICHVLCIRFSACSNDAGTVTAFSSTLEEMT